MAKNQNNEIDDESKSLDYVINLSPRSNLKKGHLVRQYKRKIKREMEKIEKTEGLELFLKTELHPNFSKIAGAWDQYKNGTVTKSELITCGVYTLEYEFIKPFEKYFYERLNYERGKAYLTLLAIFLTFFGFTLSYFLLFAPIDVSIAPKGNFIFPGHEGEEWIFTMVMGPISVLIFGYIAIFFISHFILRFYVKLVRKNQKFGAVHTEFLGGRSLFRKLFLRAFFIGLLSCNLSLVLASQESFVELMRSVSPHVPYLLPDPELMIQLTWIVVIPCIFLLVPIWLMMDIGLVKTNKVRGVEFESINLAGSKAYKYIKGYAGIGFAYQFVILIYVWALQDVPLVRTVMRIISPIILISFMFPLVILVDYKNQKFKEKLWNKLKKAEMNKKLTCIVKEEVIENYRDI
jgi:hypothetical protein